MSAFKVGDRVICNYNGARPPFGTKGKVIYITNHGAIVEFDNYIGGHDGFDIVGNKKVRGKPGHCYYLDDEDYVLDVPTHPTIIIHTDGITTTALLKEGKDIIRKAHAVCSPSDTYDHEYGVRLALDRLYGHEVKAVPPSVEAEDKAICAQALQLAKKRNVGSLSITAFPQKGDKDTPTFCTVSEQVEFKVVRYETYHPEETE